jgi:hypothetical protein
MRLFGFGIFALGLFTLSGCAPMALPSVFNASPTPPPTQVPVPTRVAIAVPTPTAPNLFPGGDNSEAATMLKDFIVAVAQGDLDGALTYWNTSQPGQPTGYSANVRKMVQGWIEQKQVLRLGAITYTGIDGSGKSVTMPASDPRVERATALVTIDGVEYKFFLTQLKGGWFIEGVNTK